LTEISTIIVGPAGAERYSAAIGRAMELNCSRVPPCGVCPQCTKLLSGAHQDLFTLDASLKKDQVKRIRALRQEAYLLPAEAQVKTLIIENADQLSAASQNALLKVLEETPAHAAFFLLCENEASLIETVRSRCAVRRISALREKQEDFPQAAAMAESCENRLEFFRAAAAIGKLSREEMFKAINSLAALFTAAAAGRHTLCGRFSPDRLLRAAEITLRAAEKQEFNPAPAIFMAGLGADIWEALH